MAEPLTNDEKMEATFHPEHRARLPRFREAIKRLNGGIRRVGQLDVDFIVNLWLDATIADTRSRVLADMVTETGDGKIDAGEFYERFAAKLEERADFLCGDGQSLRVAIARALPPARPGAPR